MPHPYEDQALVETVIRHSLKINPLQVERMTEGTSTCVYRITTESETLYLRILPEEDASFGPEAALHEELRTRGVKVPAIHVEPYNEALQRSIMVTGEIKGQPLSQSVGLGRGKLEEIMREAGRDLAMINSVPVAGFGWIQRDAQVDRNLRAPWPDQRTFALEYWDMDLAFLTKHGTLSQAETTMLAQLLKRYDTYLDAEQGYIAHGDFDSTHIYQLDGHYSGIIDFGEIRGVNQWYDLAHFHLREGEHLPFDLQTPLVQGYDSVKTLPADYQQRICFNSILINIRILSHILQTRPPSWYTQHQLEALRQDLQLMLS
ncbi:phosphotransferase family protein [Dictyobacter aurantiacus]|uniref:Aminoglycoside phosphotransferase domain-containing protein n=1 Tax=Dictyobacter aurantiacus TaxID=1936993 RepID=A0A401ZPM8_9CHLR|nr:phosphotransferase [Dictyobacter aurantiacus]GCE08827.1 hypothetical protein KDAU_61560 [Dictyobacter aurantiacus]